MTDEELYKACLDKWGARSQFMMLFEEMGELMTVINHHARGRVRVAAVIEEIIDVELMLNEIKLLYPGDYAGMKRHKIKKILNQLDEESDTQLMLFDQDMRNGECDAVLRERNECSSDAS